MSAFIFTRWDYSEDGVASFTYAYEDFEFTERIRFSTRQEGCDEQALKRALFLAWILIGTSYYKCFPVTRVEIEGEVIDAWQASFFTSVYQEGLSQFAYENHLGREQLARFEPTGTPEVHPGEIGGVGDLVMQSGGKDSLLLAAILEDMGRTFTPWYVTSGDHHPAVLDDFAEPVVECHRMLDHEALRKAREHGALNGHVPVTYIVSSLAVIQAILLGKKRVLTAIGHEGEEPHAMIDDLSVNHQWSKTFAAEQAFSEYLRRYIASDIELFSPLRRYSELRIAELFAQKAWPKYGRRFSSCNRANYQQGHANETLTWCGTCPKCVNSYVLFAPFVERDALVQVFNGRDLFADPTLEPTFRGLLGIDGAMKPLECVGEVDELRLAYHMAQRRGLYAQLSFEVPQSTIEYTQEYENGGKI